MDVVYIILIVAGVVFMLSGLLFNRRGAKSEPAMQTSRPAEQAEMENRLQRLSKQIKQEQDLFADDLQRTRTEMLQELSFLRKRVDQLELASPSAQAETGPVRIDSIPLQKEESAEADMLALRERYRRVFELSKEGLTADEIAKRLGAGRGEIDLIFSLASKKERGHVDG